MTGMDELRTCYKCDYETRNPLGACPQCGHQLRTSTQVKRLGIVLAVVGAVLTLFMGGIAILVSGIVLQSSNPHASSRFTGGPGVLVFMYGLFAVVELFGVTSLVAGIYQIRHGRRNTKLVRVILVLAGILIATGYAGQMFL